MMVVVANNLPDAVRGRLKCWFIEPKPNVFVSGLKDTLFKKLVDYLFESCGEESGLVIFCAQSAAPGYRIYEKGKPDRKLVEVSGLQLILEPCTNSQTQPF